MQWPSGWHKIVESTQSLSFLTEIVTPSVLDGAKNQQLVC